MPATENLTLARDASYDQSLTVFPPRHQPASTPAHKKPLYDHAISFTDAHNREGVMPLDAGYHRRRGYETDIQENLAQGAFGILALLIKGSEAWYEHTYVTDSGEKHEVVRPPVALSERIERRLHSQIGIKNFANAVEHSLIDIVNDFGELYPNLAPVMSTTMERAGVDGIRLAVEGSRMGYPDPVTHEITWPLHKFPIEPFIGIHDTQGREIEAFLAQGGSLETLIAGYEILCPGMSAGQIILDEIAIALTNHPELHAQYRLAFEEKGLKGWVADMRVNKLRADVGGSIARNAIKAEKVFGIDVHLTDPRLY